MYCAGGRSATVHIYLYKYNSIILYKGQTFAKGLKYPSLL